MMKNTCKEYGEKASFQKAKALKGMYTILLCDDDLVFLDDLHSHVSSIFAQGEDRVKVYSFTGMEDISSTILHQCDIAILDIDFAGKRYNGIDIAKRLRGARSDAVIIFLTNYLEYAPEGYEVNAFRYLLKSDMSKKIELYLDQALEHFNFQIDGAIIETPISSILYIESQRHKVKLFVQLPNSRKVGAYALSGSIGKMEEDLADKGFLRVHKSYLVNMAHIHRYTCHQVDLDNGMSLKSSAARYAEQKAQYLLWKGEIING